MQEEKYLSLSLYSTSSLGVLNAFCKVEIFLVGQTLPLQKLLELFPQERCLGRGNDQDIQIMHGMDTVKFFSSCATEDSH